MRLLRRGDRLHPARARTPRPGWFFLCTLLLAFVGAARAGDGELVLRELQAAAYADVRAALLDAIVEEGLAAPTVSQFGAMLARTAPDLGHRPDFYAEAEIFSFCSAQVSARMVAEDLRHIALCPMTIALYTLPARPGVVFLASRPPALRSSAGDFARALLIRIVERTTENAGLPPSAARP